VVINELIDIRSKKGVSMSPVLTCLVERNALFGEGLKSLLSETAFRITHLYPDLEAMGEDGQAGKDINLVIIGIEVGSCNIEGAIRQIRDLYPESRLLILATRIEVSDIISAFAAGADGYLLRDIAPPALLGSLNMIALGEKVYPVSALAMMLSDSGGVNGLSPSCSAYNLSDRQMQILKCLADGETNKQIALRLDITEATVKVHIKSVLRKLSVSNRTQAAIWAVNEGLGRRTGAGNRPASA
jgi:two-component system nitrate/nitrite response regulator NarL